MLTEKKREKEPLCLHPTKWANRLNNKIWKNHYFSNVYTKTIRVVFLVFFLLVIIHLLYLSTPLSPCINGEDFWGPNVYDFNGKIILIDNDFTDDPENHKWNTIQEGLNDAVDGDIVYVYQGSYLENLSLNKKIALIGESRDLVKINGGGKNSAITTNASNIKLSSFTILNAKMGLNIHNLTDISNLEILQCTYGIYSSNSASTTISKVNISRCKYGVYFTQFYDATLNNCTVYNSDWGIYMIFSKNITLQNSILHDIENKSIMIASSTDTVIETCTIYNNFCGVALRTASNNHINNSIFFDNLYGIEIYTSNNTIVANSTLENNDVCALYIFNSSQGNIIHHNNFIGNQNMVFPQQVLDKGDNNWNIQSWDNSTNNYRGIGNYWDDYYNPDENKDGIIDIPYSIPGGNNQDFYPLVNRVGWPVSYLDIKPITNLTTQTEITFVDESIDLDGNITNWFWEFGDGATSIQKNPCHRYTNDNIYNATLTVTDDKGNTDTVYAYLQIQNTPPSAKFTCNLNGYNVKTDGTPSNDTDGSIINYCWDWGDGTTTYGIISTHIYSTGGIYNITLVLTDDDGQKASITQVIVFASPIADFHYTPTDPTSLETIAFTDQSYDTDGIILKWNWEFGDGQTSIDQNPIHVYSENGYYQVNLSVQDNANLTHTINKTISILNIPPTANFAVNPINPTDRDTINYIDLSSDLDGKIVRWQWHFGDGNYSQEPKPQHQYKDGGSYQVKLIVFDNDNASSMSILTVIIGNCPPTANFSFYPSDPSKLDILHFIDNSFDTNRIINWTWAFGDGSIGFGKNISHQYKDSGTYTITLSVTDDDETQNSTVKEITICNIKPLVYFSWRPRIPKTNQIVIFNASGSVDFDDNIVSFEWDWDNDGIYELSGITPLFSHTWKDNGDYAVTLRIRDSMGAISTQTRVVRIANQLPLANFTYTPLNPEPNQIVTLNSTSNDSDGAIKKYLWNFGDGVSTSIANPQHIFPENGIYSVQLTVWDDDNANITILKTINVNIPPVANFTYSPLKPTVLDDITFIDTSYDNDGAISTFQWDFGDGNLSYTKNVTHKYANQGNYSITLTIYDDTGVSAQKCYDILIRSLQPFADFICIPGSRVEVGTPLHFIDNSFDTDGKIVNWTWNFDDGTIGYGNCTNHSYSEHGEYYATLTVRDNDGFTGMYIEVIDVIGGNDEEKGIPGFECISLILMLIPAIFLIRKTKK